MDEHFDWRSISAGITLGMAALVIGSVIASKRRADGRRSSRIRDLLSEAGILPKPRHAHVGPITLPETVREIPEVFLRAFRER